MTGSPRLSVLVPVYNEVATVRVLLERVRAVRYTKEIIVVDDCSTDGTRAVLEEFQRTTPDTPENRLVLVFHEVNQGKGAAWAPREARAEDDVGVAVDDRLDELPVLVRVVLEVGVLDDDDVARGAREARPDGVAFAARAILED